MLANSRHETRSAVRPAEEVVEVCLLLPVSQAAALEAAAQRFGLTIGQMARWALREFCADEQAAGAGDADPQLLVQP